MARNNGATNVCGVPNYCDAALADKAKRALDTLVDAPQPVSILFGAETVDIRAPAVRMLREVLD